MNVLLVKFVNGEEIICSVDPRTEWETAESINVQKPFGLTTNAETGSGLMMYPFSIATMRKDSTATICLYKSAIMFYTLDVPADLAESYRINTSNIVTPTPEEKKLILG